MAEEPSLCPEIVVTKATAKSVCAIAAKKPRYVILSEPKAKAKNLA